ncbi:predicted protein [Uncinocarpus reesii 1704]|uniref:Protein kinase domain-containing protein n=1 Tax=Uncinocarpus reesii (strain UAMH 1704) TaxID=336963 RepID=C4JMF0_UNCRE|nr:uncharacterized protein UREG_04008 [Uncinocarpus reesii 1704]EEP79162.1 predicted protein [Uncinocarpus reesii 1704]
MALQAGRVLHGRLYDFQLEKPLTKCSTLFKASVLPQSKASGLECTSWQPYSTNTGITVYHISVTFKYIRALVDTIGDFGSIGTINVSPFENSLVETSGDPWCLALEWMDHTLAAFDPKYFQERPKLLQTASWSVLKALSILKEHNLVHSDNCSDVKRENILVSNIDSSEPTVKLADLGTKFELAAKFADPKTGYMKIYYSFELVGFPLTLYSPPNMNFGHHNWCLSSDRKICATASKSQFT